MISKGVLIHYNGEWVQKEGSDDYNGLLALVGVPDNYNVGDVKKRAMDISGFLHGPCFDVYGLINVSGSAFKQRFKSGSEAMFNFYVGQASGVPRFFTIKYRKEVKVDISPLTPKPTNGDDRGSKDLPYTLLTPVHNLKSSSCDDYESENEMAKRDGGGKGSNSGLKSMRCFPESTSGPKARRCLKPVMTPSFKKICCLHDTSSTPASILDGPEPTKDMKYNDLRVGNTFKSKGEMRLILVTSKIERNFEYIATKYDRLRFIAKCRDKTCKWRMCTVPLNSCGWWRFAVANDVHTCGSNKRTDQDLRTNRVAGGIAELFKHKLKDLDAAFMPKQLVKDIKRKYGVVINYRYGYSACKRGIEHIKGIPEESYQHLVGYSYMLGNHNVGTVSEIVIENEDCFLYYFFALGVCIQGFKNCFRPAFAVDGTHLIGLYK
ncbi:hypothetical protein MKX01_026193 [Papaver californicum]|nr:hypothetical protein MKX01_026193 [Papaver californicum]